MILILHRLMPSGLISDSIDIAIIGAGPHALTLVTHVLEKRQQLRDRIRVFDPSGAWMQQWQRQFESYEIPHLRSPAVHHPDPHPFALRGYAEGRFEEFHAPYDLPGTRLFQDFCQEVIRRWELENHVVQGNVMTVSPVGPGRRAGFELGFDDGTRVRARRVVYAGGGGSPNLPDWFAQAQGDYPADRLKHAAQVRLSEEKIQTGDRVLIVGSGLTSGHLAIGAVRRGATVVMMARRSYYEKLFDAEPGWLGPKYLKDFWAETSWEVRATQVKAARNGGSLTPAILTKLRKLKAEHRLAFHEHCQIRSLVWANHEWIVQCEGGEVVQCDRIWVATGSQLNIQQHPLFAQVLEKHPIDVVEGFPVLNEQLRWKGCPLYLMGGFAGLQVGPTARNLSGARMASERITAGLIQQH
jgi:cation diffusion facilitator CzcD-associated flavoprotein CzcO